MSLLRYTIPILAAALTVVALRGDEAAPSTRAGTRAAFGPASAEGVMSALGAEASDPAEPEAGEKDRARREVERETCRARLAEATRLPALPGAPELEERRAPVLLYAKAEPVLFVRAPQEDATSSQEAVTYRAWLGRTSSPYSLLKRLWSVFSVKPDLGRSVLLREGYLYADKPELAFALVELVSAQLLFSDQEIWVQRGERLMHARRTRKGEYVFVDGPERGQEVRLLLFDRVGVGAPPLTVLHRDLRSLRHRLGFDQVRVVHLGESEIVSDLRYGSLWVPTLLESKHARLELGCEVLEESAFPEVERHRELRARRERVLEPLRAAMLAQVEEGLPFDEPLTEYGQQDGQLRRRWLRAYQEKKHSYELNGDRYYVFNARGRPLVPQVCIDFLFDTFERASGTWWRPRAEPRERVIGKLDFGTNSKETLRRATSFLDLARTRSEWFELYELPESERIPFKFGRKLAEYLEKQAERFSPGDIVMIRGYAPWDKPWMPPLMHVHSFFVYESDPMTGMAMTLAGNPGRPLLQTWQFEAFRTPERSIWYRIRPELAWLESVTTAPAAGLPVPPPLVQERNNRAAVLEVPEEEPAG
ncbi:MAG TPA: hypothetical protein VF989_00660 [Polyangiaceae bacterium]